MFTYLHIYPLSHLHTDELTHRHTDTPTKCSRSYLTQRTQEGPLASTTGSETVENAVATTAAAIVTSTTGLVTVEVGGATTAAAATATAAAVAAAAAAAVAVAVVQPAVSAAEGAVVSAQITAQGDAPSTAAAIGIVVSAVVTAEVCEPLLLEQRPEQAPEVRVVRSVLEPQRRDVREVLAELSGVPPAQLFCTCVLLHLQVFDSKLFVVVDRSPR
jgi:hypothetical protein